MNKGYFRLSNGDNSKVFCFILKYADLIGVREKTMWHVYILKCGDKSLYTGIALDIARRIKEHSSGKGSKYLRGRLPLKLVYSEKFRDRSSALKREAEIKRWTHDEKRALISGAQNAESF